ncbi:MAG: M10 family metallopeptidase C-terminal domain-containing protein [Filomicrobium sp.]
MSNAFSDALDSGYRLSDKTVTYAFSDDYFAWNSYEMAQFRAALEQWSNVADLRFVQTANEAQADFLLHNVNDAVFGQEGILGAFFFPGNGQQDGYFNWQGVGWDYTNSTGGLEQGGFGFSTILHEVGHGLGLAHPHDDGGTSTVFTGVTSPWVTGYLNYNQSFHTVMSYIDGRVGDNLNPYSTPNYGWSGGPMAFDIYTIQQMYGANQSYKTGNDTYQLMASNGTGTYYQALWDAGGIDTIEHRGSAASTIDLRAASVNFGDPYAGGYLSSVNGVYGGYTIANGVVIENARGGSGRDFIFGNSSNNVLIGNNGHDRLFGMDGRDVLKGGDGHDLLDGGLGNDVLRGGDGNDTIKTGEGANAAYGGFGHDVLTGGSLRDTLVGDQHNDRLIGGGGFDRLFGGSGRDALLGGTGNDRLAGGTENDVLNGGSGNDLLYGEAGNDRLFGLAGDDILHGGSGRDLLRGGDGRDRLIGSTGDDLLDGGAGNDFLAGGAGRDRYWGGEGNDTYAFANGSDTASFSDNWGDDVVRGFRLGEDRLDLRDVTGLNRIGQLTIEADGRDTLISFGGNSIRLLKVDAQQIDADDILL